MMQWPAIALMKDAPKSIGAQGGAQGSASNSRQQMEVTAAAIADQAEGVKLADRLRRRCSRYRCRKSQLLFLPELKASLKRPNPLVRLRFGALAERIEDRSAPTISMTIQSLPMISLRVHTRPTQTASPGSFEGGSSKGKPRTQVFAMTERLSHRCYEQL
ncbi:MULTISPECIES: hypothetical protein [unclassified Variovorax]|uniref:hypothetical protein n=1 Tax=unclassified Variovorax TaxID=663243 RepID=UPI0011605BFF|nr:MULTISPECIES: hypothetical protein [unclassified Variovorax]